MNNNGIHDADEPSTSRADSDPVEPSTSPETGTAGRSTSAGCSQEDEESDYPIGRIARRKRYIPSLQCSSSDSDDSDGSILFRRRMLRVPISSDSDFESSSSNNEQSDKCPICFMTIKRQVLGTPASCSHHFCLACIQQWSKLNLTCPVDRKPFQTILVRHVVDGTIVDRITVEVPLVDVAEFANNDPPTYCERCGRSDREDRMLLCDHCDLGYHLECLIPPLDRVPDGDWFCDNCLNNQHSEQRNQPYGLADLQTPSSSSDESETFVRQPTTSVVRLMPRTSQTERIRRHVIAARRANESNIRRRPKTRRKRRKRKSASQKKVFYDLDEKTGEKFAVKKTKRRYKKRRKTKKRKITACNSRRTCVASSRNDTINVKAPSLPRWQSAIPTLSLFGHRDELEYFSEDDIPNEIIDYGHGSAGVAVASTNRSIVSGRAHATRFKSKQIFANQNSDVLSDILTAQSRLHSRETIFTLGEGGTVRMDVNVNNMVKKQPANCPQTTSNGNISYSSDNVSTNNSANTGSSEATAITCSNVSAFDNGNSSDNSVNSNEGGNGSIGNADDLNTSCSIPDEIYESNDHNENSSREKVVCKNLEYGIHEDSKNKNEPIDFGSIDKESECDTKDSKEDEVDIYGDIEVTNRSNGDDACDGVDPPGSPAPTSLNSIPPLLPPPIPFDSWSDDGSDSSMVIDTEKVVTDPNSEDEHHVENQRQSSTREGAIHAEPLKPESIEPDNTEPENTYWQEVLLAQKSARSSGPKTPENKDDWQDDEESEGDDSCPNSSIYSKATINMAKNTDLLLANSPKEMRNPSFGGLYSDEEDETVVKISKSNNDSDVVNTDRQRSVTPCLDERNPTTNLSPYNRPLEPPRFMMRMLMGEKIGIEGLETDLVSDEERNILHEESQEEQKNMSILEGGDAIELNAKECDSELDLSAQREFDEVNNEETVSKVNEVIESSTCASDLVENHRRSIEKSPSRHSSYKSRSKSVSSNERSLRRRSHSDLSKSPPQTTKTPPHSPTTNEISTLSDKRRSHSTDRTASRDLVRSQLFNGTTSKGSSNFRKPSKQAKERNYRSEKDPNYRRRSRTPKHSTSSRKRKEIERYNVRAIIAEKPRRSPKDRFGRSLAHRRTRSKTRSPSRSSSRSVRRRKRREERHKSRSLSRRIERRMSSSRESRRKSRKHSRSHSHDNHRRHRAHTTSPKKTASMKSSHKRKESSRKANGSRSRKKRTKENHREHEALDSNRQHIEHYLPHHLHHHYHEPNPEGLSYGWSEAIVRSHTKSPPYPSQQHINTHMFVPHQLHYEHSLSPPDVMAQLSPTWTPPRRHHSPSPVAHAGRNSLGNGAHNLTVILPNDDMEEINNSSTRKKKSKRRRVIDVNDTTHSTTREKKRRRTSKNTDDLISSSRRRRRTNDLSSVRNMKEVYASGDNILVSVSFPETDQVSGTNRHVNSSAGAAGLESGSNLPSRIRRPRSNQVCGMTNTRRVVSTPAQQHRMDMMQSKPVAIIDLELSPFKEITPSPKDIIVLTDSDNEGNNNGGERTISPNPQINNTESFTHLLDKRVQEVSDGIGSNLLATTASALVTTTSTTMASLLMLDDMTMGDNRRRRLDEDVIDMFDDIDQHSNLVQMDMHDAQHLESTRLSDDVHSSSYLSNSGPKTPPEPTETFESLMHTNPSPEIVHTHMRGALGLSGSNDHVDNIDADALNTSECARLSSGSENGGQQLREIDNMKKLVTDNMLININELSVAVGAANANIMSRGPNTPPGSPDVYDPFEPTKSPSPPKSVHSDDGLQRSVQRMHLCRISMRDSDDDDDDDDHHAGNGFEDDDVPMVADMGVDTNHVRNASPGEIADGRDMDDPKRLSLESDDFSRPSANLQTMHSNNFLPSTLITTSNASIVTSTPPPSSSAIPIPINLGPSSAPSTTTTSTQLATSTATVSSKINLDSPYSPGSSDYEDLFEPPDDTVTKIVSNQATLKMGASSMKEKSTSGLRGKSSGGHMATSSSTNNVSKQGSGMKLQSAFDALFGPPFNKLTSGNSNNENLLNSKLSSSKADSNIHLPSNKYGFKPNRKKTSAGLSQSLTTPNKSITKHVGVKMDEDHLKILDELPNSAVEMQVKDKFLKKLNRQERVVEEVKLVLKPHYNKKHINKEEYKDILRRAVPKICHNKSGEINPTKIKHLIEAYVKKVRQSKKVTSSSSKM